jgi:hypothetical protein
MSLEMCVWTLGTWILEQRNYLTNKTRIKRETQEKGNDKQLKLVSGSFWDTQKTGAHNIHVHKCVYVKEGERKG